MVCKPNMKPITLICCSIMLVLGAVAASSTVNVRNGNGLSAYAGSACITAAGLLSRFWLQARQGISSIPAVSTDSGQVSDQVYHIRLIALQNLR